jgi:tetratricopeptide (TPR) repeat protein
MSAGEWPHLKELLGETLRRSGDERAAFLEAACGADLGLRREVESLAAAHDEAGAFLDAPIALTLGGASRLLTTFGTWGEPGAQPQPSERFPPGTLINGRYRTERLVGTGGMGSVYRVTDTARSRTLALKTIGGGEHFLNLFKIEFRTLAQLTHPNLAHSYDFEPIAGSADCCFTMEFVDGRSIFDATEGVGWPGVVDLLVQLCRVLAYVHNRGIVHRDIKPTNVLVRADGVLKLVDFGLVGTADDADRVMGTPAYVAPELMNRGAGDHRADLYSLGVLVYQLLCRRLPFAGLPLPDVLYQRAHAAPRVADDVDAPAWLKDLVIRLCAPQPSDRFRNANHVIEAINTDGGLHYPLETAVTRESYVLSGRFVGRQTELETLSAWSEHRLAASRADAPFLLVSGQSGVGKSRLVRELRQALQLDRRTFVEGNCFEGAAVEYGAFAEVIAQVVPLAESRGGTALVDRDWHALVKVAAGLQRDREVPPAVPLLTPEAERRRLLDTVAGFLVEASALEPYVLYINDLQWAPQGTTDILRHLHRRIAIEDRHGHPVRLAIAGSYRDDETDGRPLEGLLDELGDAARILSLQPLAALPMRQLIQSMFGLDDIPERFSDRVLEEAAGSPFFLEEVVRGLVENGSVFVEAGTWQTATAIAALEIPAGVVATLQRRLAMLADPDQHTLLRTLAAYKKPMPTSLLADVVGLSTERAQEALRALTIRHMVAPLDGGRTYRTAHDRLRTLVYEELGPGAPTLHGRIARTLEASTARPPLSELAHHYWLAADEKPALKYALLAGESALSGYANDEAIEHLEHGLTLLDDANLDVRVRVMEQLADAHFLAGHYDQTKVLLLDVNQRMATAIDHARIQRKLGEVVGYSEGKPGLAVDVLWNAARQLGARRPRTQATYVAHTVASVFRHFLQRPAQRLIPVATEPTERARLAELAGIYLRIGYLSFFGDPRLILLPVFRAANVGDRLRESKEHSQVHAMVAVACAGLRQRGRALKYGEEAIAEAERTGSPWHIANARNLHGVVLIESGRWSEALAHAERARDGFTACGDHFQLAISLYTILEVLHGRGELRTAIARGRDELMVYERLGLQIIGKGVYIVLGQLMVKAGDAEGLTVIRDALARAEHGGDTLSRAWAHIALGDSHLQLGDADEAIDQLERGLAIRDTHRFDLYVVAPGSALLAQAHAAKLRARSPAAATTVRAFERHVARAQAAARRFPPMRSLASMARGHLWRFRGRPAKAIDCFTQAATAAEQLGARLWQADALLERGVTLLESSGRSSADAAHALGRAAELFNACGASTRERRAAEARGGTPLDS